MTKAVRPPRSITSFSVAKAAGVSQSTVSLVMSGKAEGRVSKATQTLVEKTARQLGYHPNASAQMLRTGVLKLLGLAVPDVQQPFFGQVLVAAELAARENNHGVLLIDISNDPAWVDRLLGMIDSRLIAGCIVYASDGAIERRPVAVRRKILLVELKDLEASGIDLDLAGAMEAIVDHLAGLGHTRIGYLAAAYERATFSRRFDGFLQNLARHGLCFDPAWRAVTTFDLDSAMRAAEALLAAQPITALFCDDDLLAAAAYRAAHKLGRAIPDELSVVGFNDIAFARMLTPELTTVAIPAETIGRASIELLLKQLKSARPRRQKPLVLGLTLTVRGSTRQARP